MNAKLSQRAGKVMNTPVFMDLSVDERNAFVNAVEQAKDFDDLGEQWKKRILEAEKQLKKP